MSRFDEQRKKIEIRSANDFDASFQYSIYLSSDASRITRMLCSRERDKFTSADIYNLSRFCEDFVLCDRVGVSQSEFHFLGPYLVDHVDANEFQLFIHNDDLKRAFTKSNNRSFRKVLESDFLNNTDYSDTVRHALSEMSKSFLFSSTDSAEQFNTEWETHVGDRNSTDSNFVREEIDRFRTENRSAEMNSGDYAACLKKALANWKEAQHRLRKEIEELEASSAAVEYKNFSAKAKRLSVEFNAIGKMLENEVARNKVLTSWLGKNISFSKFENSIDHRTPRDSIIESARMIDLALCDNSICCSPDSAYSTELGASSSKKTISQKLYGALRDTQKDTLQVLDDWSGEPQVLHTPPILRILLNRARSRENLLGELIGLRSDLSPLRSEMRSIAETLSPSESIRDRLKTVRNLEKLRNELMVRFDGEGESSVIRRTWSIAKKGSPAGIGAGLVDLAIDLGDQYRITSARRHFLRLSKLGLEGKNTRAKLSKMFGEIH
jgi:prefoldin subunit 5